MMGHNVSHTRVAELLHRQGYSLQSNQKVIEGNSHPNRNTQFIFIDNKTKLFIDCGQPVISVDTKKKELVGNFKNSGREFHMKGNPVKVLVHDFKIPALGKVNPLDCTPDSRQIVKQQYLKQPPFQTSLEIYSQELNAASSCCTPSQ